MAVENARMKKQGKQVSDSQEWRERMYDEMLLWRGINREMGDKPCPACGGAGIRAYGDTSAWGGGVGGQMITSDICDKCWGSGRADRPWVNLRKLSRKIEMDNAKSERMGAGKS